MEAADAKVQEQIGKENDKVNDILRDFERELGNNDQLLYNALATQEAILTERIQEIKGLFMKSDEVFMPKGETMPGATGAILPMSAPTAPFATATAMKELPNSNTLLRGTIDALQVEVNQLRGDELECQDADVGRFGTAGVPRG